MSVSITAIYAALLTALLVMLSVRVVAVRFTKHVSLGDGGDADLRGRIRAHGNFIEYTPMALILMGLAEMQGGTGWLIHALGLALLAGRTAHAIAVSPVEQILPLRIGGMGLTFFVLIIGALANLWLSLG